MKKKRSFLYFSILTLGMTFFSLDKGYAENPQPEPEPNQSIGSYYEELLAYYKNEGFVVRNDGGIGLKTPANSPEYNDPFEMYSLKRFPKENPGKPDFQFQVGLGISAYNDVNRPLTSFHNTKYQNLSNYSEGETWAGSVTGKKQYRPANESQGLGFTLIHYNLPEASWASGKWASYGKGAEMGSGNKRYTGEYQGLTFLEYDDGEEEIAKPIQFRWGKDETKSTILWNKKQEKIVFVSQETVDKNKLLVMSVYPNKRQQNFTNEFQLYNFGPVKNYRLLYSALMEGNDGGATTLSVPYISLGVDANGKPKGFYATNTGKDKTIMSWRVDIADGPENFGIAEELRNNQEFGGVKNLPIDKQLVAYTPQNGTGIGVENTPAAFEFGELLNPNSKKYPINDISYSSSISFKSHPKKVASGDKITMRFGAGVDTLYDKPAITEFVDMTKKEDEDLKLDIRWFDQNPKSSGLTILPIVNGEELTTLEIKKPKPEVTQGDLEYSLPKDKFKVGVSNTVKFIIKDSEFNPLLPSNDKANIPHYNETSFKVDNLRKIPIAYKDTGGNTYPIEAPFESAVYELDGKPVKFKVPATVGEKKNPLESILPAGDSNVSLNKTTSEVTISKVSDKYKEGITVLYKIQEVNASISKLETNSKKPILEDIKAGKPTSDFELKGLEVGKNLDAAIKAAQERETNKLKLDYDGYTRINGYKVFIKDKEVTPTPTAIPDTNFAIKYTYTGEANLTKVPTLSFGEGNNISNDWKQKTELAGKVEDSTVEMYDTRNSEKTKTTVALQGNITNEEERIYGGQIRYAKGDSDQPLTNAPLEIMTTDPLNSKNYNSISLKDSDQAAKKGLYMLQFPGNYNGNYKGTLVWKIMPSIT